MDIVERRIREAEAVIGRTLHDRRYYPEAWQEELLDLLRRFREGLVPDDATLFGGTRKTKAKL